MGRLGRASYLRSDLFDAMQREMAAQSAELCACLDPSDLHAIEAANASLEASVTAKYNVFLSLYEALVHRIELVNVSFVAFAHCRACSRPRPPTSPRPASFPAPPSWRGCPPPTSSTPS